MNSKLLWSSLGGVLVLTLATTSFTACGSGDDSATAEASGPAAATNPSGSPSSSRSPDGASSNDASSSPTSDGSALSPLPPLVEGSACADGSFEMRKVGVQHYESKDYDVIVAVPCEYVLSYARKGVTYAIDEMPTFYVVHSNFELPYIAGVMDEVAFTPGAKNKGWANGLDVASVVQKIGALPFIYHVRPGYDYGYFTKYDDGQSDIYGAFRPTWLFKDVSGTISMDVFDPSKTASWPRHRGGWNPQEINQQIGFGFFVNQAGDVFVPKNIPLARKMWNDPPQCVVINKASAPVPVTRTQFPGDESYYMAETFMPGYASVSSPGDLYWGHKGTKMSDVAKWDETLPGNFDKPIGGGCSADGYSVGHTNGFTWPELRDQMRDKTVAGQYPQITKDELYKVSVYEQKDASSPLVLQGTIGYEWHGDVNEWYPTAVGDHIIALDSARGTYRISGHLGDPNQRAFVVIEDL